MSLREPITPESLCVALNRATSLRLAPREVVLAYHHWRWVAHLGSVPISGTFPFWTHKSLCFEAYPAVKMGLYPL